MPLSGQRASNAVMRFIVFASGIRTEARMLTAITRFLAWIGSLMRRRHFVSTTAGVTPPTPPPTTGLIGQPIGLLFLLTRAT